MNKQIAISADAVAPPRGDWKHSDEVSDDVAYLRIKIVNVAFVGRANTNGWVLIDTGIGDAADAITRASTERFGRGTRPSAIILTHAHFDHIGGVKKLADEWDVPVYAHALERPYLDGTRSYPPPDKHAGGGIMPLLSPLFPRDPIDLGERLRLLPLNGAVPAMPGWRWIHTPGHTPGHISLWREEDRTLLAGDAFITTRQESAYAAMTQEPEMHGPPRYFTPDWAAAGDSVRRLAALNPELVVTGHGRAMRGPEMREALHTLARDFDEVARPQP